MKSLRARIVLASSSPIRRKLLKKTGVRFAVVAASSTDETTAKKAYRRRGHNGTGMAGHLARMKAISVSERIPVAWVIGCDQILVLGKTVLSKPSSTTEARQQLVRLRGKSHQLISAVAVARAGKIVWEHRERAQLTMRKFSESFLEDYLRLEGDRVKDSVGGYKLEESGIQLFSGIEGDYFAILGLPLLPLMSFLRDQGAIPA